MRKAFSHEKKAVIKGLLDAGHSQDQVAEVMSCSRWMVRKVRDSMEADVEFIRWYKRNRSNLFAKVQMDNLALHEAILGTMTEAEIAKMTVNEKAAWVRNTVVNMGITYDKERLENDLSTENVAEKLQIIMQVKAEDGQGRGEG